MSRFLFLFLISGILWASPEDFARPPELLPNIAFWTRVYGEWTTKQIAIVDTDDLSMVYRVIDLPNSKPDKAIKKAKDEVAEALQILDERNPKSEQEVEGLAREIYLSLKEVKRPDKYQRGDYLRAQNGLKDRFEMGYRLSGAHDKEIKARLKKHGLPEELIALVFVESLFYPTSRSHVGATGLWQFMRGTAKEFMRVNRLVDERLDPVISTDAAIAYLKTAKARLGEWPLVITSYNYGRAGIARAVDRVGSKNIEDILKNYDSSRFGFAARNYYAEFLAALDVYRKAPVLFAHITPIEHWDYEVIDLKHPVSIRDLLSTQLVEKEWFMKYNPALSKEVRLGKTVLPVGFTLRVPPGKKDYFSRLNMKSNKPSKHGLRAVNAHFTELPAPIYKTVEEASKDSPVINQ